MRKFIISYIPININEKEPINFKCWMLVNIILITLAKYIKKPVIILIKREINIFFDVGKVVFLTPKDNPSTILSILAEITNKNDDIKLVKILLLSISNILNEIIKGYDTNLFD